MLEYDDLRSSACADPPTVKIPVSRKIRQARARTVLLVIVASTIPSIWIGCSTIAENAICAQTHWARPAQLETLTHRRMTRRKATVLFADMRGYTAIAERLPPARVVPLLDEFFRVLGCATEAHGGEVFHMAGDGMMAGFGVREPGRH